MASSRWIGYLDDSEVVLKPFIAFLIATWCLALTFQANATSSHAAREKRACAYCHTFPPGAARLNFRGMFYKAKRLSFKGFLEEREAKKAGVKPGAMGPEAQPTKPYTP